MHSQMSKHWVDTHFHVFDAGYAVEGARYVPHYSATLSDWLRQARGVGVRRGVCVQPSFLGTDNSLMLEVLRSHADMLRGIAVIAPGVDAQDLAALDRSGVRGIRLNLAGMSHDIPEWTRADKVWEALHAAAWHLEVHTDPGKLPHVLAQLPADIPLVVDHMAKPRQAEADDPSVRVLKKRSRSSKVHVKLSGAYRLGGTDPARLASLWLDELGPDALLWGSDWPCTNHEPFADFEKLVQQALEWIGPEHLEQVMVRNPMALYWGRPCT